MVKRIPYLSWREQVRHIIPQERRIGDDLLVVKDEECWNPGTEPFIQDVTTAVVLTEGETQMSINTIEYHIEAPAVIVLLPDVVVCQKEDRNAASFSIIMSKEFIEPMTVDAGTRTFLHGKIFQNPVHRIENLSVFFNYRDMLLNLLQSAACNYKIEAARHLTLTLMYGYMLTKQTGCMPIPCSRNEQIVKEFLELVRDNYTVCREVAQYADRMCITPKYLSMAVKDASGKTPLEWIEDYTVSAAKAMLSSSEDSIDTISIELNFGSQSLFGKFFKRVTGMSPREYRKSLR